MKREILFRGKRIDNGEWVYGTPIYPKGYDKVIITTGELAVPNVPNFGFVQYEVIPETVGQFTGLEDKSGNKIYIGDILQYNDNKYIIRESRLGWRLMYQGDRHSTTMWIHKYEKIGTIFDNEGE